MEDNSKTILEFAEAVKTKASEGLHEEFLSIPKFIPGKTFKIARDPKNFKRNRYPFFMSYDQGRVVLLEETGDSEGKSDFINANYVDGHKQEKAYIATQGVIRKYDKN